MLTGELPLIVERELNARWKPCRVAGLARRPSAYRASCALEELRVTLDTGEVLPLVFKQLGDGALTNDARRVRPRFVRDPQREIEVYDTVLPEASLGTAYCYGAVADEERERYWLFLEHVAGRELYQAGDLAVWHDVARWLARLHARFDAAARGDRRLHGHRLLRHTEASYRGWRDRAVALMLRHGRDRRERGRRALDWLSVAYDEVLACLLALPETLVHGEFYASNVLIQDAASGRRVCPVDWEMAGLGPGLLDLAALVAGRWSPDERTALALAYRDELSSAGGQVPAAAAFLAALACCRVQIALQWLGWSGDWLPPPDHRHDWLGDILEISERSPA